MRFFAYRQGKAEKPFTKGGFFGILTIKEARPCGPGGGGPQGGDSMSVFAPVSCRNIEAMEPYFSACTNRICDNTAGVTFQWRNIFQTHFAIAGDTLVTRSVFKRIGPCYSVPVGPGDVNEGFAAAERDAWEQGEELRFACVGEDQLPLLEARYGGRYLAEEKRDWFDYLYEADSFRTYSGKKLHGQKNHVNRFYKEFPEAECREITEDMFPDCIAFLERIEEEHPEMSEVERNELKGTMDLIELACRLNQRAACLVTRLGITALSVGEIKGDTLFAHAEKGDVNAAGAYPAMAQAFVNFMGTGFTYVNREDDAGDEGIRYSKLNYKPIELIPKYLVTVLA